MTNLNRLFRSPFPPASLRSDKLTTAGGTPAVHDQDRPRAFYDAGQLICVNLEEDEDDHAGDRNVEPDREREPSDAAVHGKASAEREEKRRQHHGQRHDGKNDVAGQDRKVEGADRAEVREASVAVQGMIDDVADQEERGKSKRKEHARAVGLPVPVLDEI